MTYNEQFQLILLNITKCNPPNLPEFLECKSIYELASVYNKRMLPLQGFLIPLNKNPFEVITHFGKWGWLRTDLHPHT